MGLAEAKEVLFCQSATNPPELSIRKGFKGVEKIIITDSEFLEIHREVSGQKDIYLVHAAQARHIKI